MSSHERLPLLAFVIGVIASVFLVSTNGALLPVQSASETGKLQDLNDGRLPGGFIPSHYDIEIAPDIYQVPVEPPFNFTGQVTIFVNCTVASSTITLNSERLTITDVTVLVAINSTEQPPNPPNLQEWTLNDDVDFLILNFTDPLVVGVQYVINVTYHGQLFDPQNRGIYYDEYLDDNNVTRYMVATQLESIFARRMFPSFDEPALKATFTVTVLRKDPLISLSNMNLLRTEPRENGWLADYYAESPVMSTYLVCVCIGNFVYVETDWQQYTDHPIRIYSRPEVIETLRYAAKIAPVIHAWLENETGIEYTLPKMDHIALPSKGGAMENWGLITYGESSLCVNQNKSAVTGKMNTVAIVAHELAHQWYGNIVTCEWWNDIWLNEGFANHYNYYPQDSIGWPGSEGQHFRGTQPFLDTDQRNNSDPVIKNIDTSDKAPGAFSGSTYPKGGAIVRMIKGMLTRNVMNKGFTRYLQRFDSKPVTSDDLWQVLTEQAATDNITDQNGVTLNFKTIMDPWMKQMGYPLVKVENVGNGTATVTASRYFNPKGQIPDVASEFDYQWTIPVTIATEQTQDWENLLPTFYVRSEPYSTTIDSVPVGLDKWFVINANQMFFYRVHYDSNIRAAIVKQLITDHSKISSESRSQLVDDSFSLSRSLVIDETEALELTRYLGSELRYSAWNVALKHLLYADKIFQKWSWYSLYKSYLTSLLVPVYNQTGWEYNDDEPAIDQYLRKDISTTACYYGYADCRSKANELFNAAIQNPQIDSVDPNNLPNVLCVGLEDDTASDTNWNTVYDEYLRRQLSPINDERQAYLYGLSCTQQVPLLNLYFSRVVNESYQNEIPSRDKTTVLNYLVRNSIEGRNIVWNYLRDTWAFVPAAIGKFTVLRNVASTWFQESQLTEFDKFVLRNQPFGGNTNLIVQIQLLIEQNIEWINRNAVPVEKWLRNDTSITEPTSAAPPRPGPDPNTNPTVTDAPGTNSNPTVSDAPATNTNPTVTDAPGTNPNPTVSDAPSSSNKPQVQALAFPLSVLAFITVYSMNY